MMTGLTEEIRQYVIDKSEAYKRDSEDHYDFWNEHIRYVYKEAMKLAGQYHADETIVALGALLHDIALIEKAGDRKDHHLNGKILSDQILDRFSCPERLLENGSHDNPFGSGYGIYDVKNDEWMDLSVALQSDRFEGLIEVCNENKIGNIYGDMDCDYTITIVDATMIQRFLADLLSTGNADLIADYDRDGTATILDATAIQRTLAGFTTEG